MTSGNGMGFPCDDTFYNPPAPKVDDQGPDTPPADTSTPHA